MLNSMFVANVASAQAIDPRIKQADKIGPFNY